MYMKTKLFFSAIFFFMLLNTGKGQEIKSPLSPLSPQSVRVLDSIHQYLWNTCTSDWTNYIFTYITRDTLGNMTKSLERIFVAGFWMNYIQELFTYSNPAHPVFSSHTSQLWNDIANNWETFAYTHANLLGQTDEQYNKQWNQSKHKFYSGYRDTLEYSGNALTTDIHQVYDTVTKGWNNSTSTGYTYDLMNRMVQILVQNWNNSSNAWDNALKMVNTYDSNNYFVLAETFVWDNGSMSWVNSQRTSYLDYFGGRPLHITSENWNNESGQWYLVDMHTDAYMSNGSQSQDLYQVYDTATTQWINSYLTNWTFYLTTLVQHERNGKYWDPDINQWIDNAYDQNDSLGRNIESFYKYYSTLSYDILGGSRNLTAYDTAGNRGNYKTQILKLSNSTWVDNAQTNFTYDSDKNLVELIDQSYDTLSTAWVNSSKTHYYYTPVSGIAEHKPAPRLCFYENPIHTGSTINCPNLNKGSYYDLTMYDLSGKIVFSRLFGGGDQVIFDKYLPEGLYIMRVTENGRSSYTGKIIVTN